MENEILNEQTIKLGAKLSGKEEAVRYVGGILVDNGYVETEYVEKMLEREEVTSTYMGNYVAIPHGTEDSKNTVTKTGISIVTIPDGVDFGSGNTVKVLIGIAGKGDEHLEVLSKIAIICSEEENIQKMIDADSSEQILALFDEVE
ncbi:PTS sugar transporter subunit IIA [Virgibacillus siamensis]|uniref:PTS sugar transporter subunit IIA n=1 Tax=Virgibacillus siamensis TaxID=480071 RepID=UPI00098427AF|nr:PTS sugar transporter subunit IIA [Virgibacillus siamensis]